MCRAPDVDDLYVVDVLADKFNGKRLNSPNDLVTGIYRLRLNNPGAVVFVKR
jgi:hypothetical protein